MKLPRSLPTGAWIAVGLITAALLVPGASYAAATMTQIVGGTGGAPVAGVSKANQLFTGPAAPASYFTLLGAQNTTGPAMTQCANLGTVPAGKAAVLTGIRYRVIFGKDTADSATLMAGGCPSGQLIGQFGTDPLTGSLPLTPGYAVPAGTAIYILVSSQSDALEAEAWIDGYSVPSGAVTQIQPTISRHALKLTR